MQPTLTFFLNGKFLVNIKFILLILFSILSVISCPANEIDSLKTFAEVREFLVRKVDKLWAEDIFFSADRDSSSAFGKNNFYKLDIDNNHLTDLIINRKFLFIVTDKGDGTYSTFYIDKAWFLMDEYELTGIIFKENTPLLLLKKTYPEKGKESNVDTLMFQFDNFIEYTSLPDNLQIEEITIINPGHCMFSSCEDFELHIGAGRKSYYVRTPFNEKPETLQAVIDEDTYNRLVQTINIIKLSTLSDFYDVTWTHPAYVTLQVKYNNGTCKEILDIGAVATFGLVNLYKQLFKLKTSQNWQPIKP